jgi:hypothetical protein
MKEQSTIGARLGAMALALASCSALADVYTWTGAQDNNLSNPANWAEESVPTNGTAFIDSREPLDLVVGDAFGADTITIPSTSEVVRITSGALHLGALTNACRLAIAKGASLEVDGDIVANANSYRGTMTFLYSNEGTVVVHGNAVGTSTTSASVFEYADVSEANNPMQVGGIRYIGAGHTTYFHLDTNRGYHNDGPDDWVIGENGIGYTSGAVRYYAECYGHVKLYSSADWTLQNSMNTGLDSELYVATHASMTFNTSDYNDPTIPRTITLKGRLRSGTDYNDSTAGFFIEGCGTVVIDTEDMSALSMDEDKKHTYFDNSQLTVRSGATLQINEGKKILGATGRIALEAGATLALPYANGGDIDTASRIEPAIRLPSSGKAIVRLEGDALKVGVPYKLFGQVPSGYASHLKVECDKSKFLSVGLYAEEDGLYMILVQWPEKWNDGKIPGAGMLGKYGAWGCRYDAFDSDSESAFLMNINPNTRAGVSGKDLAVTDIAHDGDFVTITTSQDLSKANGVVYVMYGVSLEKMVMPVECEFDAKNGNEIVNLDGSMGSGFFKVCVGYELPAVPRGM